MERLTLDEILKLVNEAAVQMELDNCKECSENYKKIAEYLEELKSYKEAEEQGLLVRLPCKVGDTVYRVDAGAKQPIIPMTISEIHFLCYKNERAVRFDATVKALYPHVVELRLPGGLTRSTTYWELDKMRVGGKADGQDNTGAVRGTERRDQGLT